MSGRTSSWPSRRAIRLSLLVSLLAVPAAWGPAAWGASMVSGKYLGNGKPAQLAYARVIPHEQWQDATAYTLILSEKDSSKIDKPDFDAMFGKLGHALVVNVTDKGSIFGTQVCHQALEKSGFSASGSLELERFSVAGGKLSGHFFTTKEEEFFGDRWEIDLEVKDVPLPK